MLGEETMNAILYSASDEARKRCFLILYSALLSYFTILYSASFEARKRCFLILWSAFQRDFCDSLCVSEETMDLCDSGLCFFRFEETVFSNSRLCLARLYAGDYKGYVVSEETVAIRRFSTLPLSTRGNYASSDSRLLLLFVIRSAQGCAR